MSDVNHTTSRKANAGLWLLIGAGLLLLVVANSHLVYVATTSQPDCVEHLRRGDAVQRGQFSAAQSACTPK